MHFGQAKYPSRVHNYFNVSTNFSCDFALLNVTIYHQDFFHSVRRHLSLNRLHRHRCLAILGHAGPRWRIRLSLHNIIVLVFPAVLAILVVSTLSLFMSISKLSLNRARCLAQPCIPFLITSMISFTPV